MKTRKVMSQMTFDHTMFPGEPSSSEVLTQPEEVLTVKQMLERHARGLPSRSTFGPGEYYPEELGFIPPIEEMDLSEIDEARQALNKRVRQIKDKMSAERQRAESPTISSPGSSPAPGGPPEDYVNPKPASTASGPRSAAGGKKDVMQAWPDTSPSLGNDVSEGSK